MNFFRKQQNQTYQFYKCECIDKGDLYNSKYTLSGCLIKDNYKDDAKETHEKLQKLYSKENRPKEIPQSAECNCYFENIIQILRS